MKKNWKIKFNRILETTIGYRIVGRADRTPYDIKEEFDTYAKRFRRYTATSPMVMHALFKAVDYIVDAKVVGDIVECGVWRGGSMMVAGARLLELGDTKRVLYLYDTFSGMPKPIKKDFMLRQNKPALEEWKEKKEGREWFNASMDEVKQNLRKVGYPRTQLVEGKVEDTIPGTVPKKIAILRLDMDMYEPTKHALRHLFPLLSSGGVLILDNYGDWMGERDAVDEYFASHDIIILLNRIGPGMRIGIK